LPLFQGIRLPLDFVLVFNSNSLVAYKRLSIADYRLGANGSLAESRVHDARIEVDVAPTILAADRGIHCGAYNVPE